MSNTEKSTRARWQFWTYERAPVGIFGPFGPIEARSSAEARRIAGARAARWGVHVDRVERMGGWGRLANAGSRAHPVPPHGGRVCEDA